MENTTEERSAARSRSSGFTLVEVLVTVLILGLLAAVVFPVVIPQLNRADPTKASNDLANIQTGIELFQLDLRPAAPGDIEDVANPIDGVAGDADVLGNTYTTNQEVRWDGPYVDEPIPPTGASTTEIAMTTGFEAPVASDLYLYDADETPGTNTTAEAAGTEDRVFVSVRVLDLTVAEFESLNDVVDGELEVDGSGAGESQQAGRLRYDATGTDVDGDATDDTITYFLAVPF